MFQVRVSARLTGFGLGLGWVCMLVLFQQLNVWSQAHVPGPLLICLGVGSVVAACFNGLIFENYFSPGVFALGFSNFPPMYFNKKGSSIFVSISVFFKFLFHC